MVKTMSDLELCSFKTGIAKAEGIFLLFQDKSQIMDSCMHCLCVWVNYADVTEVKGKKFFQIRT